MKNKIFFWIFFRALCFVFFFFLKFYVLDPKDILMEKNDIISVVKNDKFLENNTLLEMKNKFVEHVKELLHPGKKNNIEVKNKH
jgi:hypothetical protein